MAREKNPAAVALGKRRRALMSDAERTAFAAAGTAARKSRTLAEQKADARKAALSRRLNPPWLRKPASAPTPACEQPAAVATASTPLNTGALELPDELAQLSRSLDDMPDDLLEALALALAGRK